MKPIRPYKISVYNRITGNHFAEFYSNQVPAKGQQLTVFPDRRDDSDPFNVWGGWVVDEVVWVVASPASVTAFEIARQCEGDRAAAYCDWVEVHVWPAQGPHWVKTPRFAEVLSPSEDEEAATS